ncbi:hypothetical protein FisN_5Lh256 [Fistulifera solaris]|uniref:C2 tensin-type domain-containing protein n=1 Tax=Fistulifera solaris TaxID=1519565 RepID=A0A1Z5JJ85_FISSO|nr:hypothetical protein FisN_5Lh256 [Fistulifera solaris]|eukprot:GAX13848.1 hypothetical protein FisN_5Lh256 [Fistulifera solaris]
MEGISVGNEGHSSLKRSQHVGVIYCPNGKTRTAIAIACYLKFTGQVDKTEDGFLLFLEQRCPDSELSPATVAKALPASIRTFFRNFDSTIKLKRYMNQQPLLLRSIVMRGLPVEEKPCLNIFNAQGDHVYSSHPDLFGDISVTNPYAQQDPGHWEEEEGFFPVNQILEGDFYLLCRFGGHYADDLSDPSKIIFRYANTTSFLGAGPIHLRCDRVDLMRRYAHLIDYKEFLLSMTFEASWNCSSQQEAPLLQRDSISDNVLYVRSGLATLI